MHISRAGYSIAAIAVVYFVVALGLQWIEGAYRTGFGGQADEGSHYVTGLMVRDYLAQGMPLAPMRFAENYYLHYPEVAFGHWPPVFYILQAGWTLLFPVSRASLLVLMAAITGGTAAAICVAARTGLPGIAAFWAGALFLLLPVTREFTSVLMGEAPSALFGVIALWSAVGFLRRETFRSALLLGLALSAAILTKPAAWGLALGLPLSVVLWRGRQGLLSRQLWTAGAITAILTVPFSALTLRMTHAGLEGRRIDAERIFGALSSYIALAPGMVGPVVCMIALAGVAMLFLWPVYRHKLQPLWAVLGPAGVGVVVFHCIVPTIAEPRKVYLLLPMAVIFAAGAIQAVRSRWMRGILAAAVLAITIFTFPVQSRPSPGFAGVAQQVLAQLDQPDTVMLVYSPELGGEGAFIAEVAAREQRRPLHYVLRASKQLAHSTWNGDGYSSRYRTAEEMQAALDRVPVNIVVLHSPSGRAQPQHYVLLRDLLQRTGSIWSLAYAEPVRLPGNDTPGKIEIYRRAPRLSGPVRIEIDLTDKLGRRLSQGN